MNDEYEPARRPTDAPGGDRVRFEREGAHEQYIFGGGAQDIQLSIMDSTERNVQLIGWKIMGVSDVVGDMGQGTLQEIALLISNGQTEREVKITGVGLHVEIV